MQGGHLRLHHLALPGSARPHPGPGHGHMCPVLHSHLPIGTPPKSLPYPACFPALTQPSLQRGTACPPQLSLEGSFARCSASPGWPSPPWALRDPPGPLARSLGWAGRGLPEVTQLISARAALGGAGAPPSVLQGCSGDHGIAPALRAWTGPHWTPGSSGEMQGLGFDRGSGEAKGRLPQFLPSPQMP